MLSYDPSHAVPVLTLLLRAGWHLRPGEHQRGHTAAALCSQLVDVRKVTNTVGLGVLYVHGMWIIREAFF